MIDAPEDVRAEAERIVAEQKPVTRVDAAAAGIIAERERIAIWHEAQADTLEAAIEQILKEGGVIEISRRSLVDLHRGFATAIRRGLL